MKLVLASQNQKKLREMQEILADYGVEVLLQSEVGLSIDVEETGVTFIENATLKAKAVQEASGLAALADDSGLVVDALDGAPGAYSARYGGEGLTDTDRWKLLLDNMKGKTDRSCRFVCAICCILSDGTRLVATGECYGTILEEARGEGGFGYDPVFYVPELGKTMAELSPEEKHRISHRGAALGRLKKELEHYLNGTKQ